MIKEGLKAGTGPSDELLEVSFGFFLLAVLLFYLPERCHSLIMVFVICVIVTTVFQFLKL